QNLRTPKLLAQNRRSPCIDPVHLKNMLRQVQSDRSNLAHGWLPFAADSITAVWHSDAARGPSTPSFDDLVGEGQQLVRHGEAGRLCSLEIDDQLEFSRLLHWQIGGSGAAKNLVHERGRPAKIGRHTRTVGDQTALLRHLRFGEKRGQTGGSGKSHNSCAL